MSTTYQGRVFDWVSRHDPRSLAYPVSALLAAKATTYDKTQDARLAKLEAAVFGPAPTPVPPSPTPVPVPSNKVLWDCPIRQDQQQTGMCIGYGFSDTLATPPHPDTIVVSKGGDDRASTAAKIYEQAQKDDGSPANDQTGASVTSGAKATTQLGWTSAYHWCLSVDDVVAALAISPVVLGIPWTADMMTPDAKGQVHATGSVVGGHCIEAIGWDGSLFTLQNSWGPSWAIDGRCTISKADLASLLAQNGEAAVLTKV